MAMTPTLPLPKGVNITVGSSMKETGRVLRAQFGNGYAQRSGDGLNSVTAEYQVNFTNLTRDESQIIIDFLRERGGYKAFWFRPPIAGEALRLWTCEDWTRTHTDGEIHSISTTMKQQFTP